MTVIGAGKRPAARWQISANSLDPRWVEVPALTKNPREDLQRLSKTCDEVRGFWDASWSESIATDVEAVFVRAQRERADNEVVALLYWPINAPVVVSARILVSSAVSVALWKEAEFEVDEIQSLSLGLGYRCIKGAVDDTTEADGRPLRIVAADFVFSSETETIVVAIDPTPVEFYISAFPGLYSLMQTIEVFRADGSRFVSTSDAQESSDEDRWGVDDFLAG